METRELRYFVAVAQELHFGRAAQRLQMSQPPLSRAIQQLERRLGVTLLIRNPGGIALTPAGEVLLTEALTALDAVEAAERRTRRAAAQHGGLVLATKAGLASELLSSLLEAYAARPGAIDVDIVLCGPGEQVRQLREGRADVALLQRPYDTLTGFATVDLRTERQVLVLPANHPLAASPYLSVAEVKALDLPLPRWPRPDGTFPQGPGPQVRDHTQLFQLIALGRACGFVPESVQASLRDAHAVVPVLDAPDVTTVIAWPRHSRSQAVADLIAAATEVTAEAPAPERPQPSIPAF